MHTPNMIPINIPTGIHKRLFFYHLFVLNCEISVLIIIITFQYESQLEIHQQIIFTVESNLDTVKLLRNTFIEIWHPTIYKLNALYNVKTWHYTFCLFKYKSH